MDSLKKKQKKEFILASGTRTYVKPKKSDCIVTDKEAFSCYAPLLEVRNCFKTVIIRELPHIPLENEGWKMVRSK